MCAVKEMVIFTADPQLRMQTIQSFEQEASMLAVLNHPAIPLISDYFTEVDRSYLILELVEGKNLEEWLDSTTELLDQPRVLGWALQICEALVHLHSQKPQPVIFRDLKPSNEHDKWSADDLIFAIVVERPDPQEVEQHLCADRGYDYDDVHEVAEQEKYLPHIKHRRRRNESIQEECPIPGELRYPARRWVVERTLGWLAKRCC